MVVSAPFTSLFANTSTAGRVPNFCFMVDSEDSEKGVTKKLSGVMDQLTT